MIGAFVRVWPIDFILQPVWIWRKGKQNVSMWYVLKEYRIYFSVPFTPRMNGIIFCVSSTNSPCLPIYFELKRACLQNEPEKWREWNLWTFRYCWMEIGKIQVYFLKQKCSIIRMTCAYSLRNSSSNNYRKTVQMSKICVFFFIAHQKEICCHIGCGWVFPLFNQYKFKTE